MSDTYPFNSSPAPEPDPHGPGETPEAPASAEHGHGPLELVLVKQGQRFTFRYTPGAERRLLADLVALAGDPTSGLDWFDVAVLSHQVGGQMSQQLQRLLRAS